MIYRFGRFELNVERRWLSCAGETIDLQPKVFDLLHELVRAQGSVVTKDALLDAIWPGVVVADGAVQRAMSLARAILKAGGLDHAVKTYRGRGYRFCAEVTTTVPAESDAESNEREALTAHHKGVPAQAVAPLERACGQYQAQGRMRDAARCALRLAQIEFELRKIFVAKGWLARAKSLLAEIPEVREHGDVQWLASRFAAADGDLDGALGHAEIACTIGRRLNEPEVATLGLAYKGLALIALGRVQEGVACQDEAAAAVLSGGAGPLIGGMVYCSVIWGCRNRCDWDRAAQWTEHFEDWCADEGTANIPGLCRMHRAEVLSVTGELDAAESELGVATTALVQSAPWAEGEAYRVLGDLKLARGDLDGAAAAFEHAHACGWDPQPGLAWLRFERGDGAGAVRMLERALADTSWYTRQRRGLLLAHLAIVSARTGEGSRCTKALAELTADSALVDTDALRAWLAHAQGEAALAFGDVSRAAVQFGRAIHLWHSINAPLNAALVRVRLAAALADSDPDAAELELGAAKKIFSKVGARR